MYIPANFEEKNKQRILDLIHDFAFAPMISLTGAAPLVSHLPFSHEPDNSEWGKLTGHMARANPHWRDLAEKPAVLVIFQGPHGYISPTWYGLANQVPTWNYAVVHVYGRAAFVNDSHEHRQILRNLTGQYETGRTKPWVFHGESPEMQKQIKATVGFRIQIDRIEAKFKLGQNKPDAARQGVIRALNKVGNAPLAEMMRTDDSTSYTDSK